MKNAKILKPYLLTAPTYSGGKGVSEITTKAAQIYKLSSNENPIGYSPLAAAALRDSATDLHFYPDRTGERLQVALADFYENELSPAHFVATNSGSEAIEFLARGFLKEGLECIVSSPSFQPYTMFSGWNGATIVDVPLLSPDFGLDVDGILAAINERTRLVFVTTPNNPTGTYVPKSKLDALINSLPDHVILVLDEVYYHFADAPDFTTALPYVKAGKNVVAINSFSKTYGLAAMRIGYAYATPELAGYLRRLYRPFLLSTPAINVAIAALQDVDFVAATVQTVLQERPRFYAVFEELGLQYWKSQGNFVLFRPSENADKFIEMMLSEYGVMVREAASSGAPDCVRVTIGTAAANEAFFEGVRAISLVLQD